MKSILAILLVYFIVASADNNVFLVSTYTFNFTVDFPMLNDGIISKCSDDDVALILRALETIIQDMGSQYLSKNNLPGTIDNVHIDSFVRRLGALNNAKQDQDPSSEPNAQRKLQIRKNAFGFLGTGGCRFCLVENGDAERRLQGGTQFRMKDDLNFVNSRASQALYEVVHLGTSDTCRKTKGKWKVNVAMAQ